MTSSPEETDPLLDIFIQLYFCMVNRQTPWVAIEMDREYYYLDDLYDLLKRKSINDFIRSLMESWSNWTETYPKDMPVIVEILSFHDPLIQIFHELSQNIHSSGNPWLQIEYNGSILSLPDVFARIEDKSTDPSINSTMDNWLLWTQLN